jgi:hypothetical protein
MQSQSPATAAAFACIADRRMAPERTGKCSRPSSSADSQDDSGGNPGDGGDIAANTARGSSTNKKSRVRSSRSCANVLSRASVYAPLRSYDGAMKTLAAGTSSSRVATTQQFLQFYSNVSTAMHRRHRNGLHGKNTSARPVSASQLGDRLQQKSITLAGGGYNAAVVSTAATNRSKAAARRKKAKKRRKLERSDDKLLAASSSESQDYLHHLNEVWNSYAIKILRIGDGSTTRSDDPEEILQRVTKLSHRLEWIGARICFVVAADRQVVEKTGILVAHTAKTWRIAAICDNNNDSNNKEPPKEYCIRKEGTKLAVWVPLLDRAAAVAGRCGTAKPKFARIEIRYQSI